MDILRWILYFFIYAFVGWICEVIYCFIKDKKFTNRGFLFGPICPIYGYGALLILFPLYPLKEHWYLILALGFILTSALEYTTSYIMEKIFKMRWWDYSNHKFNIRGRVCLFNSTLFAIMVMALVYLIHPQIIKIIDVFPNIGLIISASALCAVYLADNIYSFISVAIFSKFIVKYHALKEDIRENYNGEFSKYVYTRLIKKFPRLRSIKSPEVFEIIKQKIISERKRIKEKIRSFKDEFILLDNKNKEENEASLTHEDTINEK